MREVLLTTIALAAVGAATSAGANTIDIGWSTTAGGAPTTLTSVSTPGSVTSTFYAGRLPFEHDYGQ